MAYYKVWTIFVERIVGEMHVEVIDVWLGWFFVCFCAESRKSFFVYINDQWIKGRDENIESEIKFLVPNEHRIREVLLHNELIGIRSIHWDRNILNRFEESNTITLASWTRFWYKCLARVFREFTLQFCELLGDEKSFGEEIEFIWKIFLEEIKEVTRRLFMCEFIHLWEPIETYIWVV